MRSIIRFLNQPADIPRWMLYLLLLAYPASKAQQGDWWPLLTLILGTTLVFLTEYGIYAWHHRVGGGSGT